MARKYFRICDISQLEHTKEVANYLGIMSDKKSELEFLKFNVLYPVPKTKQIVTTVYKRKLHGGKISQ